jgi:hypothetical protein
LEEQGAAIDQVLDEVAAGDAEGELGCCHSSSG